ncbi:MAG: type II toxin-antitoxin system RelE/ParE family toxin [Proteobacteria bacterium]|nr:type II toxin-antitoxin system RelE/ParE family toxin [Pseudomonadota bacterium]
MIQNFKHRGLKRLFERNDKSQVRPDHLETIEDILAFLDIAEKPQDLDKPGYNLHPLKGNLKGFWSVKISGNWRIIFRFEDGDAFDVNLIDYH